MSSRMKASYVTHLHVPEEFKETFNMFLMMMERNKTFMSTIKEENRKKGIASPAVRYLIQMFVDKNKVAFMSKSQGARDAGSQA